MDRCRILAWNHGGARREAGTSKYNFRSLSQHTAFTTSISDCRRHPFLLPRFRDNSFIVTSAPLLGTASQNRSFLHQLPWIQNQHILYVFLVFGKRLGYRLYPITNHGQFSLRIFEFCRLCVELCSAFLSYRMVLVFLCINFVHFL